MVNAVKVKIIFENNNKYYKINSDQILKKGMIFLATTRFGQDFVEILCPKRVQFSEQEWAEMVKDPNAPSYEDKKQMRFAFEPILDRMAKDSEIQEYHSNNQLVLEYLDSFKEKISFYELDMKVINLHFTFNKARLVCIYAADKRVDFRELVKDLGSQLKYRIEMFQLGVREATGLTHQCGLCGRQLCCSIGCTAFINDKKQFNSKLSKMLGVCGKVRCCSIFEENDTNKNSILKDSTEEDGV